jgi:nitric oxide reductase NorE protein
MRDGSEKTGKTPMSIAPRCAAGSLMPPPQISAKRINHWPGEPALWSLICSDMILFGVMFVVYTYDRYQNLALFRASRGAMDQNLGLLNTLLLLASSWFIASAVNAARRARLAAARGLILCGLLCAISFCVVKYFEYSEKLKVNITPETNLFFSFYFALTGIHLIHVIIATGVMIFVFFRCRRAALVPGDFVFIESAASFWHLVDILWIMLFALLYLMR